MHILTKVALPKLKKQKWNQINSRRSVQRKQRWSIAETGNLFSFCTALRYPDKNRFNGKVGKLTSTMSIIYRSLNIKVLRQNPHHTWYLSFFIPAHFEAWNLQFAEYESTASDYSLHWWVMYETRHSPTDKGQFWSGQSSNFIKLSKKNLKRIREDPSSDTCCSNRICQIGFSPAPPRPQANRPFRCVDWTFSALFWFCRQYSKVFPSKLLLLGSPCWTVPSTWNIVQIVLFRDQRKCKSSPFSQETITFQLQIKK